MVSLVLQGGPCVEVGVAALGCPSNSVWRRGHVERRAVVRRERRHGTTCPAYSVAKVQALHAACPDSHTTHCSGSPAADA